jgi:hypothetical protein
MRYSLESSGGMEGDCSGGKAKLLAIATALNWIAVRIIHSMALFLG